MAALFVFDAFAFSYYLGAQVGELDPGVLAFAEGYGVSFKRNFERGFAKADLAVRPQGKVYGALFTLSDEQMALLHAKVLTGFHLELRAIKLNKNREAVTLVPVLNDFTREELPKAWYLELMCAGLEEVTAPRSYIEGVRALPIDNAYHGHSGFARAVLGYPGTPKKVLGRGFALFEEFCRGGTFSVKAKRHALNGRSLILTKAMTGFSFETTTVIKRGYQDPREFIIDNPDLVLSGQYRVGRKGFVASRVSYGETEKLVGGTIQAMESVGLRETHFWRLLIPVPQKLDLTKDFEYRSFLSNGKLLQGMLRLTINNAKVDLYGIKNNDQDYVVIDLLEKLALKAFQEIAYVVLLNYALLKGVFFSGEGFFLGYDEASMSDPRGIAYHQMSDGRYALPGIFTTNAFTGIEQIRYRRNNKGSIPQNLIKRLQKDINLFSSTHFSALCELMRKEKKILQAITQIIHNQVATLEIKIPVLYVALETITGVFTTGGHKDLKPIQDNIVAQSLVELLQATANKFVAEKGFTDEQVANYKPFYNRINGLNNPPNSDKLSKVFPILGYTLKPQDQKVIDERNAFLHGFTPRLKLSEEDHGFKELYDLSLRLHFLLAVLLLKKVGFSGKIINYNKLHEHITQIYREEDVLVMI